MWSHNSGEVWGICVYKHYVYTCGDDNNIYKWNFKTKSVDEAMPWWTQKNEDEIGVKVHSKKNISKKKMTASSMSHVKEMYQTRALAVNTKFKHIAVAFNDWKIVIRYIVIY